MGFYSDVVIEISDSGRSSFRKFVDDCKSFGIEYEGTLSKYGSYDSEEGEPYEESHGETVSVEEYCRIIDNRSDFYVSIWYGKTTSFELGLFKFENKNYLIVLFSDKELLRLGYDLELYGVKSLDFFTELFLTIDGVRAILLTDASFKESYDVLSKSVKLDEDIGYVRFILSRDSSLSETGKTFKLSVQKRGVYILGNYYPGFDI